MSHAAAIHFLEKASKSLEATIALEANPQLEEALKDVKETIETLNVLDYVSQKADEIRNRDRKK